MPKKGKNNKKKDNTEKEKYKKANIPKAVREQCWLATNGKVYEKKCYVNWCENMVDVFNYHVGHDKPESQGGTLDIDNIKPICARCNLSMSDNYTIEEWQDKYKKESKKKKFLNCF